MRRAKIDNVRRYWRRRVAKLEARLAAARAETKAVLDAKLAEVRSDPMVPKDTMYILAPGSWCDGGAT